MPTLRYLDTCLPDYFQGFSGHVYAVPVCKEDTGRHVMLALFSEIDGESVVYNDGMPFHDSDYDALKESVKTMFHGNPCLDKPWSEHAPSYEDDKAESVYAYFGVVI